jgi:DNA polymerase elongation subunit (family B)
LRQAAALALGGDVVGLRGAFLDVVHRLRTAQVPLADLCVQAALSRSPPQYRHDGVRDEPYEVLLAAGVRAWRVGERIRYFRARGGEARLLREGDDTTAADADSEYYVQRLVSVYAQQFGHAFSRADFLEIFALPPGRGPFDLDERERATLARVRPALEPL